jgi:hypothetical protein
MSPEIKPGRHVVNTCRNYFHNTTIFGISLPHDKITDGIVKCSSFLSQNGNFFHKDVSQACPVSGIFKTYTIAIAGPLFEVALVIIGLVLARCNFIFQITSIFDGLIAVTTINRKRLAD